MKPLAPGDQGPLKAALSRVPDRRAMMLNLGKPVTFVLLTVPEAEALVVTMRQKVAAWFGHPVYDGAELSRYVRCSFIADRSLVRVDFLPLSAVAVQGALAANPEMFLAFADAVEAAGRKLRPHGVRP